MFSTPYQPVQRYRLLSWIALLAFGAIAVALISQYVFNMQPCAWCVFQRLLYLVIGVAALIGAWGGRAGSRSDSRFGGFIARLGALLAGLLAIGGIVAAWYQYSVASNMLSCAQTFADKFISRATGLDASMPWLFGIYATCADAKVKVLGVEYALWSLALFAVILLMALTAFFFKRRSSHSPY